METQLPDRLSALEQENAMLRSRLQACEQSHALLQAEVAEYRRREQDRQAQTEPEPIGELTTLSDSLEHRLLEATAIAANTLLTIEDFDQSVNTALKILGESLETDRINVIEFFDHSSDPLPHWRMLYEWHSPNTPSQIAHSELAQGTHQGLEATYKQLTQGQGFSYLLDEMPEPFRSGQAALGVKALHVVPIFVEDKLWGIVGFDDCCEAKRRSPAELAVLKIAANCLGSAIQRERTQQALLQTEQLRSQELEHLNTELQQTLDRLTESEQRYRQLMELASEGIFRVEYAEPISVDLPVEEQARRIYQHFRYAEHNLAFAQMYGYDEADALVGTPLSHVMDAPENAVQMEQFVRNGHQMKNQETIEFDRFGRKRHFFNNGFSIIRDGYAIGGWGTQIDITELRETQQALLQAEQAQVAELAKANEALKRSLDALATDPDLDRFLIHVLREITQQVDLSKAYLFMYNAVSNTLTTHVRFVEGQVYFGSVPGDPPLFSQPFDADLSPAWQYSISHRKFIFQPVGAEDDRTWDETKAWHIAQGHSAHGGIALVAGDQPVGFLGVAWQGKTSLTAEQAASIEALANQATLAIQVTQLAEEAKQAALAKLNEVIAREQEIAAQERAAELEKANETLQQRDRLLSTIAEIMKDLLENPQVDEAIALALQRIGEAAGISRIALMQEKTEAETGRLQHCIVHEWTIPGVQRQIEDPRSNTVYNDDYGTLPNELHAGQSIWYVLEDLPEPARTQQGGLAVKSTGAAPIFIEGQYFGCVGFDDCVNYRQWTTYEIDVLISGAGAIGAALYRQQLVDRLIEERIRAEQERVVELAKTNQALKNSIDRLAADPNLDAFLGHVVLEISQQLNLHTAWVELYNPESQTLQAHIVVEQGVLRLKHQLPEMGYLCQYSAQDDAGWNELLQMHPRQPLVITLDNVDQFLADEQLEWQLQWTQQRGIRSGINILLVLGDRPLGVLVLFSNRTSFTPEELELAQALAQQATLAIQLTRLAEEAKHAAILDERNRMASEIHDTLAQAFTGISIQLEVAKPLIHRDLQEARQILDHLSQLAETGLTEARRSVWALYPPAEEYADLAQLLYDSVEQMTRNTDMVIEVNLQGTPCPLPPFIGMNLLRIGQEALTNALKHAQAQTITIELAYESDRVFLTIRDNGRGFIPPDTIDNLNGGFGLMGMYERCDRINAQLSLTSQPGQGTQILVEVPHERP
jgi:PAS domain S-box-containing protein